MTKGDKITVLLIGRPDLKDLREPGRPDYEESGFIVVSVADDQELQRLLIQHDPQVIISFGDWQRFKFIAAAPYAVRARWISVPQDMPPEQVAQEAFGTFAARRHSPPGGVPLVSVFTPAYRPGARIYRPLQSLFDQTYPNWEWILVDDSDDGGQTWGHLQELARLDHRIKPWHPTRRSGRVGELKRWACGLASGEILAELDHDDELTDSCLHQVVKAFESDPAAGMVYTDCAEVIEGSMESYKYPDGWGFGFGKYRSEIYRGREYSVAETPINSVTMGHIVAAPNHLRAWRRGIYLAIGGHNPELPVADDYDLMVRTFLFSKIVHLPILGYLQYRNVSGNTTFSRNAEIQRLVKMISEQNRDAINARAKELGCYVS